MREKSVYLLIFILMTAVFTTSCRTIVLKSNEVHGWLKSKQKEPPAINLNGTWLDIKDKPQLYLSVDNYGASLGTHDMGWGRGYVKQKGSNITGNLGVYSIKGIVSGEDVYLTISYNGKINYVAHLTAIDNHKLGGNYYTDREMQKSSPMLLGCQEITKLKKQL